MATKMTAQGIETLALHGRYGDNVIGHLTPGEMVLPRPIADDPVLRRALFNAFDRHEIDPYQYTVGHYQNSINPLTGVPEFGFFKKVGKFLKKAAPVIGSVVGFAMGGPTGAAIGSGIGTAAQGGDVQDVLKSAAFAYAGGKVAVGAGVNPNQGIASLNPFGEQFALKGANLLGPQAGAGGIGGFFQDIGAAGAAQIGGPEYVARNIGGSGSLGGTLGPATRDATYWSQFDPTSWASAKGASPLSHVQGSWGGLSGLEKAGVGALGLAALGSFGEDEDPAGMPEPSGELGGYLQNPLTPATIPAQYANIPGSALSSMGGFSGGVGANLDPATAAYLAATMEDDEYSRLMFPEFQRVDVNRGGRIEYGGGGNVKLPDGNNLSELDLRNTGGDIVDPQGSGDRDTVKAKLADGEFVFTKLAAKGLGKGNHQQGIESLYALMHDGEDMARSMGLGRA